MDIAVKERFGISSFGLKIIAVFTMFIEHIGTITGIEIPFIFIILGRVSFPIFCFLIAQGAIYTSDKINYAKRLLIFAVLSEIPYDLAFSETVFNIYSQNVIWTLLLGLLSIMILEYGKAHGKKLIMIVGPILMMMLADMANTSYGFTGVLCIFIFYIGKDFTRGKQIILYILGVFFVCLDGFTQTFGFLALIPILLYNNKPGYKVNKNLFYMFYPAHLFILYIIYCFSN